VVSGHDEQSFAGCVEHVPANRVTIVILMGLGRRRALAALLVARGWRAATPAAIVVEASLPGQQVWRGTLHDLASGRDLVDGDGPGIIVIGAVAALALAGEAAVDGEAPASLAAGRLARG
jgi:siroheme synthase